MRRIVTLAVVLIALLAGTLNAAAKRRKPAPAAVSARERQRALAFVNQLAAASLDAVENPTALVPFFDRLSRPTDGVPLRVLHYGDSHTASDDWTNAMRMGLQSRFGIGGPGFALAGHPYRGYRRFDLAGSSSKGWYTEGTVGHTGDGRYGLGGVSIATNSAGETVSLSSDCPELKLYYLQQPGGGQLDFSVDGSTVETISTEGETGAGFYRYQGLPGAHQFALRTVSPAPVKLFGWVAENRAGVTYESLGINGAQAPMLLDWDESILAGQLAQHEPALIVLAYGTNEAVSPRWEITAYAAAFGQVLDRFRRAAPLASILVVGPPDCQFGVRGKKPYTGRLETVIGVQRQIALDHGCAFWDWRARMGGAGSVLEWARAGLGQPDHVHLTGEGYRMVGDMLLEDLMGQYRRFQAVKTD